MTDCEKNNREKMLQVLTEAFGFLSQPNIESRSEAKAIGKGTLKSIHHQYEQRTDTPAHDESNFSIPISESLLSQILVNKEDPN